MTENCPVCNGTGTEHVMDTMWVAPNSAYPEATFSEVRCAFCMGRCRLPQGWGVCSHNYEDFSAMPKFLPPPFAYDTMRTSLW